MRPGVRLLAIDGLPAAGKSTLADALAPRLGAQCIYLDDFLRPEAEWPSREGASFPFEYIRYDEFMDAVRQLVRKGICSFAPFDWTSGRISPQRKTVRLDHPVIIEGVSTLHPELAPLYDLRIWVESDAASTLAASLKRGVGNWAREWEVMFLPSVQLYLRTDPEKRADLIVEGRGARHAGRVSCP
jgi:uridine kinase